MYPLKFSDKGLPVKPRIERGEILAERGGFEPPIEVLAPITV
jgi:hypothetical protein